MEANRTEMAHDDRSELDERIWNAVETGDFDMGASLFMQRYGGDILAFILGRMRDESASAEVFSEFGEDFWRGLPGFKWKCSLLSWAYTLARNAIHRYRKSKANRPPNSVPLSECGQYVDHIERLRSATKQYLQTEVKNKMRELREKLPEDDQILLILRVDKNLSWNELAAVLSGEGDRLDREEVARWSARLRQRFKTAKERLRDLAREEKLIV